MTLKAQESAQKLRGGYYTPERIADYIASWCVSNRTKDLLEPSAGDGNLLHAACKQAISAGNQDLTVHAHELMKEEADKSRNVLAAFPNIQSSIITGDFLGYAVNAIESNAISYDAVIGNPPYIRYQYLEPEFQAHTKALFDKFDLPFTKHTNAWVPFVIASIEMLRAGGRLAMVIPSEIIHVLHAQPLRDFLLSQCHKTVIIDPKALWFDGTQQGTVILFAQKKLSPADDTLGVAIEYAANDDFLNDCPETLFHQAQPTTLSIVGNKWTPALLKNDTLGLYNEVLNHAQCYQFDDVATVDAGMVTGANEFFLVNQDTIEKHKLHAYSHPMFGRSEHCKGVLYDHKQHQHNIDNGKNVFFLKFDLPLEQYPQHVVDYILSGEAQSLHTRYKCRIRELWYNVPSMYSAPMSLLRRCHDTPRFIANPLEALTTDTAYRIRLKENNLSLDSNKLTYCFINPITAISAELHGRYYGGGVLEMVPSEIRQLSLVLPGALNVDDNMLRELDSTVRKQLVDTLMLEHGHAVLSHIGLTKKEVSSLVGTFTFLRKRRHRK